MAAYIGQYAESHTNDCRVAGTHSVHTVVEVGTVGDCRDDKDCHDDKQNPSCRHLVLAAESHDTRVVEVMVLDKRNGGFQCLNRCLVVFDDNLLPVLLLHLEVDVRLYIR